METLVETTLNIGTGFIISWAVWLWVVPLLWPHLTTGAALGFWVTTLFTVTSFIRSYVWRRFFNNIGGKIYGRITS
jgi:hypothetical protein